jgi:predicted amidophosphoribosyltransferase
MVFILSFFAGFITYSIICRYADMVCKQAAREAEYNCDRCTAHCVGYHCHCQRNVTQKDAAVPELPD